ncbi:MAG: thioredoxin family protein [Planctomycetes bacterium]|nr:thioredoxin family protein [Planctomycetota bacterium]
MMKTPEALMIVLASVLAAGALEGCSYFPSRADDALEMFDLGLTFSKTPQFSAYMNCPVIAPIGYGSVDGYYAGMGGGGLGVMKHHQESAGLLVWGREEVGWDEFDPEDADTLSVQGVGVLGLAEEPASEEPYTVACIHYFHLGWVGLAANVRWLEIPDFLAGLFFLDPLGDDGADGCQACEMMAPILVALREKYAGKANVVFVHVREEELLAARFGIRSIPVQVLFDRSGEEVFRHSGFLAQDEIEQKLAELCVE